MIKRRRYYYGALLSLCLAHSAQAGLFDDTEARAQIGEVRQQLQQQKWDLVVVIVIIAL